VPIAILLRPSARNGCGGLRSDDRRPGPGGHLGRVVPHGTVAL